MEMTTYINTDTTLTSNIFGPVVIGAGVDLNLNGFGIISNVAGSLDKEIGVYAQDPTNCSVYGGYITGFFMGIRFTDNLSTALQPFGNSIHDVLITHCTFRGILTDGQVDITN